MKDSSIFIRVKLRAHTMLFGFLAFLFFFSAANTPAQHSALPDPDTAVFHQLHTRDGLTNASVSSVFQDDYGFMWLGTQAGLQRYDGSHMRLYKNEPFADNQLSHHLIQTLYYEGEDTIWVGTYGGLNRLDSGTGRFDSFESDGDDPETLDNNVVVSIARDSDDTLWVGTLEGLNRMDDEEAGTFTRFAGRIDSAVRSLFLDSQGAFWVGTIEGLYHLAHDDDDDVVFEPAGEELPSQAVMDIAEDADGNIWVGTWDGGVTKLTPGGAIIEHHTLEDNRIYQLLVTSSGTIYAATWGGGLAAIDPETGDTVTFVADDNDRFSLAHDVVYSLYEDNAGQIWAGTNGNGISILDPARRDHRLVHPNLPFEQRLPQGQVQSLFYDEKADVLYAGIQQQGLAARNASDGTVTRWSHDPDDPESLGDDQVNTITRHDGDLLLGTNRGIDQFDPATETFTPIWETLAGDSGIADPIVYALLESSDGTLWIGTYEHGVLRRTPGGTVHHYPHVTGDSESLSDNLVYEIYEDAYGTVWVGTNRGVNRYDADIDGFHQYLYDPGNPEGISHNSIIHAFEDSNDRLWFATRGGGLMRYERDTETWSHLTMDDGLSTNHVRAAGEAAPGVLYAAHAAGLDRIDLETMSVTPLTADHGVFGEEISSARTRLADGSLLFSGFSVITRVVDRRDIEQNAVAAPVQITGISVMNRQWDSDRQPHLVEHIELSHEENILGFEFALLDFTVERSHCYEYRLAGLDDTWTQCSPSREAGFTNLPPGEFTFEVRALDKRTGHISEVAQVAVTVVPPFWRTPWFMTAAGILAVLLAWFVLHVRTRLLTRRAEQLQQLVDERTDELSRAIEELNLNNATKDRFFSLISHDLRGPITGMHNLTRRVYEHFDTYDRDYLYEVTGAIVETSQGLEGMLSNLLEWARLQRNDVALDPAPVPAGELLETVAGSYRGAALAKNITIETTCSDDIAVLADIYRLRTVLENLMSNAVKFTRQGGRITLGCESLTDDPDMVRLFVTDTGVGIPPERNEDLFSVETVTRSQGTAGERGSGLGLTVSKEIVDRLGGRMDIQSAVNEGTTVSVTLPVSHESPY